MESSSDMVSFIILGYIAENDTVVTFFMNSMYKVVYFHLFRIFIRPRLFLTTLPVIMGNYDVIKTGHKYIGCSL